MKINIPATILKFSKIIVKYSFSIIKVLSRLFLLPLILSSPIIIYHLQYDIDNNTSIIRGIIFVILSCISSLLFVYDVFMLFEDDEYSLKSFYKWIVNNAVYIDNKDSHIKEIQESKNQYIIGQWMNDELNKDNSIPLIDNWHGI